MIKEKKRGFKHVSEQHRKHPEMQFLNPVRATEKSCGYDFFTPINISLAPGDKEIIWTDIKVYMLNDEVLEANTRSSNGIVQDIVLANTIGWIDSDYYENEKNDGNIGIALRNIGDKTICFEKYNPLKNKNDRIAQVKFSKYLIADDDEPLSKIRVGGIGSSN